MGSSVENDLMKSGYGHKGFYNQKSINRLGGGLSSPVTQQLTLWRQAMQQGGSDWHLDPNAVHVYMGKVRYPASRPGSDAALTRYQPGGPRTANRTATADALLSEFNTWSVERKRAMARKLAQAGMLGTIPAGMTVDEFVKTVSLAEVEKAYEAVLLESGRRYASGQEITPTQLINQHRDWQVANGGAGGSGSESPYANKTITTTHTSVSRDIWHPKDAKALARATIKRELGRDPTPEEFEDFVAAIQTAQEDNPARTRTKTRTKYDEHGSPTRTKSWSRTSGGIGAEGLGEIALEQAQDNPEWAEWQAVGTYFPALINMLGSGVPGV